MRYRIREKILTALLAAAAAAAPATAQEKPPAPSETVVRLTVSPAAPPDPAFRYTLVVPPADQIDGTAAPLYLNASGLFPEKVTVGDKDVEYSDLLGQVEEMPLDQLKTSDLGSRIAQDGAAGLLRQASLRNRAGWSTTIREEGFEALLPYLNHMRGTANFLAATGRVKLAKGDVTGALGDARILFSLSRHLSEEAVLIQALVGCGIAELGLDKLIPDVIQSRAAPNLYWALADLPRPMFDLREAMAWENVGVRASLAPLRSGRTPDQLSPGEWDEVARGFSRILTLRPGTSPSASDQIASTGLAVVYFPKAKQQLIARGIPAETVNHMPPTQVIGMAMFQTYDHWLDEMAKWARLPYWQAARAIAATDQALTAGKQSDPLNPAYAIVPAVSRAYATLVRVDRHVAILQTVEALRAYAAANAGKLPATLDQITDTPAPIDPTTGQTFAYEVTGDNTAELSSPPLPAETKATGLRYVVTIRK